MWILYGGTGCPTKKFTFFKSTYLRLLISLRLSSVLEMDLIENFHFVFEREYPKVHFEY